MAETALLPGARELIVALKERGHRVVLASSGKPHHVDRALDLLDVRELADALDHQRGRRGDQAGAGPAAGGAEEDRRAGGRPERRRRRLGLRRRGGEERRDAGDRRPVRWLRGRRAARRRRDRASTTPRPTSWPRSTRPTWPERQPFSGQWSPHAAGACSAEGARRRRTAAAEAAEQLGGVVGDGGVDAELAHEVHVGGLLTVQTWTSLPAAWASATNSGSERSSPMPGPTAVARALQQLAADRAQPLADQLHGRACRGPGRASGGRRAARSSSSGRRAARPTRPGGRGRAARSGAGSRPAPPRPCGRAGSGAWSRSPAARCRGWP